MAQAHQSTLRDYVLSRMITREATTDDVTPVSAIDLDLHGGLDQLPALYLRQMADPNRRGCVCELDGRVIGYQMAFVVDDGRTVILQSMRLHPDFRSLGIWPEVSRRFSRLLRDFTRLQRCAHTSAHHVTRSRRPRDPVHIMTRTAVQVRPSLEDIERLTSALTHMTSSCDITNHNVIRELLKHQLHNVLSSKENQRRLFPENRIVLSWQPFRLLASNYRSITESCTDLIYTTPIMCDDGHSPYNCSSISCGRALQVASGLRYDLDYYGSDVTDAYRHACQHLRRCVAFYQGGVINFEVFVPGGFDEGGLREMLSEEGGLKVKPAGLVCHVLEAPYSHITSKL